MRIIVVTTKLNFIKSGASVVELDLKVRTLISLGHKVRVITVYSDNNEIPEKLEYEVIEEPINTTSQLGIQKGVYKLFKKYESETEAFFTDGQVFLYGAGAYKLLGGKRPVFAHFNRELQAWPELVSSLFGVPKRSFFKIVKQKFRWLIEKFVGMPIASRIDGFSFTNPYLEETYRTYGLKTKNKYFIAGDAFDYREFMKDYGVSESTYRDRNKQGNPSRPVSIYYSSRMAPGKGFDMLVTAFSKIKDKSNLKLILGGSGPEDEKVKNLVHEFGLDQYVRFTGWAPKADHYNRLKNEADILVQPSQSGFDKTSYILLEAMAFGIPSILPGGGGLEWDAKSGALYFKPGDIDDLARKIEELAGDANLRSTISAGCYKRLSEDDHNFVLQTKRLVQFLEDSLNGSRKVG